MTKLSQLVHSKNLFPKNEKYKNIRGHGAPMVHSKQLIYHLSDICKARCQILGKEKEIVKWSDIGLMFTCKTIYFDISWPQIIYTESRYNGNCRKQNEQKEFVTQVQNMDKIICVFFLS